MHQISVWFVCKLCRSSFQTVQDLIKHKFENHFEQFKSVKHIIFEERFYDGDFDFPDGYRDHLTKSKPFDEGQVYGDQFVNTIQRPTLPPINSTYIKPGDASLEDTKPFSLSSNSDLLDNIDSRTVSFTIEQDSVIINVGTLNDLDSAATISERIARPFDIIGKENKARDTFSRIQNPFVLLKRLLPQDLENTKLGNETVTKINPTCSSFDAASHTDSIDLDFDQLSETSQKTGTSSDCEIDADLDVKPFKLNKEITLSDQTLSAGSGRKCKRVFQQCSQTFLSSDEVNGDASASAPVPVLAAAPANSTINFDESQLSQNIGKIIHINSAESLLRLGEESTIFYQKQFPCPRPKCKMSFRKKPYLTTHLNYYHGDLERRRRIASGCSTYGSNNDKVNIDTRPGTHSGCNIKETKTRESIDFDENQRYQQIKKVVCDMYADNSLKHVQKRTIAKQAHLTCPRRNCNTVFNGITSLKHHLNYSHGDLERRRLIASGCQTYGSNDDKDGGLPELAPMP